MAAPKQLDTYDKNNRERAKRNSIYTDPNMPDLRGGFGPGAKRELMLVQEDDGSVTQQWLVCAPDKVRCTGTIRRGPYAGNRCRKPRLLGSKVCPSHGGNLPNIKKAAQMRILAAADMATAELLTIALSHNRDTEDGNRLRAITALLDRAGIDGKQTITIEVKPWQEMLQSLVAKDSKKKHSKGSAKKKRKRKVIDGSLADGDGD
jgi:hypothetical protein